MPKSDQNKSGRNEPEIWIINWPTLNKMQIYFWYNCHRFVSLFFLYIFPGSLARSCKSTTTTTTTNPRKPHTTYYRFSPPRVRINNQIQSRAQSGASGWRGSRGRGSMVISGGGGAFGSGGGGAGTGGSSSGSGAGSAGSGGSGGGGGGHQHHPHHPHHHLHPSDAELLKGGGGGDSPGILGSIMNAQQQANGNPPGSPHIVTNPGSGRISLPLPLTACHRCDVCGKLLSTKLTLKRHKEQQHLQPLNNAVCNLCHKVFRTLNSLNNHKSIYHRRQKQHNHPGNSPGSNGGGGAGGGGSGGGAGGAPGGAGGVSSLQQQQFHLHPSQALNALTASAIAAAIEENAVRTAAATAGAVTPTGISAAKSEFKSEYMWSRFKLPFGGNSLLHWWMGSGGDWRP